MRTALLFTILGISTNACSLFYPSFEPIVGLTVDDREANAERQCRTICKRRMGWSERYHCLEKIILDEFRTIHYQVLGCMCECKDG